MLEKIKNTLFKIHVKRFMLYTRMWVWCWEHGAPIFVTRLLVLLVTINAKTVAIYTDAKCEAGDVENTVDAYSKADAASCRNFYTRFYER